MNSMDVSISVRPKIGDVRPNGGNGVDDGHQKSRGEAQQESLRTLHLLNSS